MNVKIFTFVSMFFAIVLVVGCHSPQTNDPQQDLQQDTQNQFTALVKEWNKAHSPKDVEKFNNLFDDDVLFYGSYLDKDACLDKKESLLEKNPDFYQQIYGEVDVEKISDNEVKCSFVKRVTVDGKTTDYPSYLNFRKIGNEWKISVEGDLVTDKVLSGKSKKATFTNSKSYAFDTPIVICGTIAAETFYGPPGYGEDPAHDAKERYYMLLLDSPIDVIADGSNELTVTTNDVTKIQLVVDEDFYHKNYLNKRVKLTGSFFYALTGHHHTDVLLEVKGAEIME